MVVRLRTVLISGEGGGVLQGHQVPRLAQQQGSGGKSVSASRAPAAATAQLLWRPPPPPAKPKVAPLAKHLPRVPPAGREPSAARRNAPVVASALRPPDKLAICCCLSSAFVMQTREPVSAVRLHMEEVGQFFLLFSP